MAINISALSAAVPNCNIDPEHQRIMRELRAMGIEPTGDKTTDKNKLQEAKTAKKVAETQNIQFVAEVKPSEKAGAESSQDNIKNDLSIKTQQMTGATQIAEFNKFKLLGLY